MFSSATPTAKNSQFLLQRASLRSKGFRTHPGAAGSKRFRAAKCLPYSVTVHLRRGRVSRPETCTQPQHLVVFARCDRRTSDARPYGVGGGFWKIFGCGGAGGRLPPLRFLSIGCDKFAGAVAERRGTAAAKKDYPEG